MPHAEAALDAYLRAHGGTLAQWWEWDPGSDPSFPGDIGGWDCALHRELRLSPATQALVLSAVHPPNPWLTARTPAVVDPLARFVWQFEAWLLGGEEGERRWVELLADALERPNRRLAVHGTLGVH